MAVQLVNYSYSPQLGCGVELILAVYKIIHTHSFVLKPLLQWHVHAQHISTLESQA